MKHRLVLLLLLLFSGQAAADYPLEIIRLQSRPVPEVIPLLKPFIEPGGSIAGMNDQLIVRTSPANLVEIKRILQRIDRPPRRLKISVRQSAGLDATDRAVEADVNTMVGKQGRLMVGPSRGDGLQLRMKKARTRSQLDTTHSVQVLEGYPAFITTGESVPIHDQTTLITRHGLHQQTTTRYRDLVGGFYVVPRLNGTLVSLEIAPQLDRPGNIQGHYDIQRAHTVVSGKLGEWISVGGVSRGTLKHGEQLLKDSRTTSQDERLLELLVEEITP